MRNLGRHAHLALLAEGLDAVEQRLCLFSPLIFDALGFLDVQQVAALQIAAWIVRDHFQCQNLCATQCSQIQACVHGLVGEFGAVSRYQNAVVHKVLLCAVVL